ncbi:FAD-dependent monooxygenase [Streptomyces sp. 4N509B]|uniref:FAD-dependent monooxygenase n=1 Tax=Streptomyces sp. 4N509B TaxID=3457413 RepID=UPI003FD3C831
MPTREDATAVGPGPRVAIVGAGIGGLAAAVALRRAGVEVSVYEQAPRLREAGVGMHLGPNGTRVLRGWGLEEPLRRTAVRAEALELRDGHAGRLIARAPMGDAWEEEYGAPHLTVARPALHALLAARLPDGVVRLGARLVAFHDTPGGAGDAPVRLCFADGTTAEAELLVGADGVHSVVRRSVAPGERPVFAGSCALRGTVPSDALPHLAPDTLHVWAGRDARLLCCPIDAGRSFTFVAVVPESRPERESWDAAGDLATLRRVFADWSGEARAVVTAAAATGAPVGRWSLNDREPLARWGRGRFTLLGDAAHPMLPHHGQGVGQALEDAVALAHCVAGSAPGEGPAALRRYERVRRPHTARVQRGARGGGSQRMGGTGGGGGGVSRVMADVSWIHRYDVTAALREPERHDLPETV